MPGRTFEIVALTSEAPGAVTYTSNPVAIDVALKVRRPACPLAVVIGCSTVANCMMPPAPGKATKVKGCPAVSAGEKPGSAAVDPACVTVSAGVAAFTLLHAELVPNAMLDELARAVPFRSKVRAPSVAFASRTFEFVNARFVIDALTTGLKSRPFWSTVLPRMTKL